MRRRTCWHVALLVATAGVLLVVPATSAAAHPLGNFTTNTYTGLVVSQDAIEVDYVLDLAEIPALQVIERLGRDDDGGLDPAAAQDYEAQQCAELAQDLSVTVEAEPVHLRVTATTLTLPPGEAGLDTLRLECRLGATTADADGPRDITVVDRNFPQRLGWRETTATGAGMTLTRSDVPAASVSARLLRYPQEQLRSPLDDRTAAVTARPGGGTTIQAPVDPGESLVGGLERLSSSFTNLVATQQLTVVFALLATGLAVLLGALHALAPGHGKTVMAAYLVGSRGTSRQALQLGMTVAVTHTLGVLALGIVLTTTQAVAPERIYPLLGLASGVLFAGVGVLLLRRALRSRGHRHDHTHGHDHAHDHTHAHGHAGAAPLTWRSLLAPGLAGGLVPSPSALVVLLGGIAIGRAWFGVTLVVAYGVGMAATLVGAGYLVLRARTRLARRSSPGRFARVATALPVVTAGLVIAGGVAIAARSLGGV